MIGRSPGALGLLLLLACHGPAMAASDTDPYLPRCKSARETQIPVPTWDDNDTTNLRQLMSTPPGASRVVYAALMAPDENVEIEKADQGYSVKYTFEPNSLQRNVHPGEVMVTASDRPQHSFLGIYAYSGFFEISVPSSPESMIALRRLETFDVVSSGRYCLGNGMPPAPPRKAPAPHAARSGSLPACRRLHESRIPIVTWKPKLTSKEYLTSAPPEGDGRIVHISIKARYCHRDPDELYAFGLPRDPKAPENGGRYVNLRGNTAKDGRGCRLDGFFMNEPVTGIHQGWTETYFGAIDRKRIVASNQFCLAPHR